MADCLTVKTLQVNVKPNARTSALTLQADGTWLAEIKAPPVDGKANDELIRLIAAHLGCRRVDVTIKSGATGRIKRVVVAE